MQGLGLLFTKLRFEGQRMGSPSPLFTAPGSPAEAQGCYPVPQNRECSPLPAASPKMGQVRALVTVPCSRGRWVNV